MHRLTLAVLLLNIISAALFIGFFNHPVYDDNYSMYDVHNYAVNGFSAATVRANNNAPGPTSYAWMAQFVRLLKGSELRSARVGALVSWILLAAVVLAGARWSAFPETWYSALLVTLIFPHTLTAMGSALTEGPALLFAVLGVMAWLYFASQPALTPRTIFVGMLGGLCLGVAVTCRQYYLALLPAAAVLAVHRWRSVPREAKTRWLLVAVGTLAMAMIPVITLAWVWKGLSSPGSVLGQTNAHTTVKIGLNLWRPVIAAFYVAFYLLWLTFPAVFQVYGKRRAWVAVCAVGGGIIAGQLRASIIQPGPLASFLTWTARFPHGASVLFALISTLSIYCFIALSIMAWKQRAQLLACAPVLFALLTVLFFILEQVGVGGNLLYYERYILQIAPFLGIISFALFPKLTIPRGLVFLALFALSQGMLWRYTVGR